MSVLTKETKEYLLEDKMSEEKVISLPKDNRLKAIIFINIFAISRSILSILFKHVNQQGVTLAEFMIWRNIGNFTFAALFLRYINKNPFRDYPSH